MNDPSPLHVDGNRLLTAEGREIWLQGVKLNPDNEVLQETLKRLQVRL